IWPTRSQRYEPSAVIRPQNTMGARAKYRKSCDASSAVFTTAKKFATVRLREATSSVFTNRITTLTRTVNTLAPPSVLFINSPSTDGGIHVLNSNVVFAIQSCFSTSLGTNPNLFSLHINGTLQPRSNYIILASGCGLGLRSLYYNWNSHVIGTNTITVTYSNSLVLSDTHAMVVARTGDSDGDGMNDYSEILAGTNPLDANSVLRITELANGNQLVVWDSVPGRNYQVLATTNLFQPMQVISPVVQASSSSSFYFDNTPDATNKFYRVRVLP
ncbi:MAG TPA: thrombospondin type 3 repeat-containing protein, partial [Verrucomicrobiae bacterium]|nr:thrombospondin type 3 repeat-containing protein [Verrucomicrobiae bacterium]